MIDNRAAWDKIDRIQLQMNLREIRDEVKEKKSQWLNDDNWAVYLSPEDQHDLLAEADFEDVDVIVDHYVDEPVILPKDAGMMPSDLHLQDNPPLYLVRQMVDPEKREDPEVVQPRMYTVSDTFTFEVRAVEYLVFINQLSADLRCPRLDTMLGKAVGEGPEWSFERRDSVWAFRRQIDDRGTKEFPFKRRGTSRDLIAMDIEETIAMDVIQSIGGEITDPLYGEKMVRVDQSNDKVVKMTEDEIDPCSYSYEVETVRTKVGERRYELGRLYVH